MNQCMRYSALLAVALGASACTGPVGDAPDEHVGKSAAALTGADWGISGNFFSSTGWGVNDGTCILMRMDGQLLGTNGGHSSGSPAGGGAVQAWNPSTNRMEWFAQSATGGGSGVQVNGTCIPNTGHRVFLDSSTVQNNWNGYEFTAEMLVPAAPNRQCFITGIFSRDGFTGSNTPVWIARPGSPATGDPNNWHFVVTSQPVTDANGVIQGPGGSATAVCFDVSAVAGSMSLMFPSRPLTEHFTNQNDIACGLIEVAANFKAGDVSGVNHDNPGFSVQATPSSAVQTTCVQ